VPNNILYYAGERRCGFLPDEKEEKVTRRSEKREERPQRQREGGGAVSDSVEAGTWTLVGEKGGRVPEGGGNVRLSLAGKALQETTRSANNFLYR